MRQKELRIALVCYGGISLAVYMHGVTKELWKLARASQATATATWQTNVHRFVDRHVVSKHVVQNVMIDSGAKDTARTPALRFSPGQALPIGRMEVVVEKVAGEASYT